MEGEGGGGRGGGGGARTATCWMDRPVAWASSRRCLTEGRRERFWRWLARWSCSAAVCAVVMAGSAGGAASTLRPMVCATLVRVEDLKLKESAWFRPSIGGGRSTE